MKVTEEVLKEVAQDALKANQGNNLTFTQVFALGYRTCERDTEAHLKEILKLQIEQELTGLPKEAQQLIAKHLNIDLPKEPTFTDKIMNMGRNKFVKTIKLKV